MSSLIRMKLKWHSKPGENLLYKCISYGRPYSQRSIGRSKLNYGDMNDTRGMITYSPPPPARADLAKTGTSVTSFSKPSLGAECTEQANVKTSMQRGEGQAARQGKFKFEGRGRGFCKQVKPSALVVRWWKGRGTSSLGGSTAAGVLCNDQGLAEPRSAGFREPRHIIRLATVRFTTNATPTKQAYVLVYRFLACAVLGSLQLAPNNNQKFDGKLMGMEKLKERKRGEGWQTGRNIKGKRDRGNKILKMKRGLGPTVGHIYLDMLELWLMPQLETAGANVVYQLDGVPTHFHRDVREFLNNRLPNQ
ncbi:hypothetical protein PR048_020301 [Dryococelus australis]|uniref:Uncharacterized protein n=1 Tax=Dryococelus australis TaxID=614101 RepID=A0ABQ9H5W8_9NEOP|nr:hypothetical protein PR048_020301 [Dryococelus australis]